MGPSVSRIPTAIPRVIPGPYQRRYQPYPHSRQKPHALSASHSLPPEACPRIGPLAYGPAKTPLEFRAIADERQLRQDAIQISAYESTGGVRKVPRCCTALVKVRDARQSEDLIEAHPGGLQPPDHVGEDEVAEAVQRAPWRPLAGPQGIQPGKGLGQRRQSDVAMLSPPFGLNLPQQFSITAAGGAHSF